MRQNCWMDPVDLRIPAQGLVAALTSGPRLTWRPGISHRFTSAEKRGVRMMRPDGTTDRTPPRLPFQVAADQLREPAGEPDDRGAIRPFRDARKAVTARARMG